MKLDHNLFLSVLRKTIIDSEYKGTEKQNTEAFLTTLNKSKGMAGLRDLLFSHCTKEFKDTSNDELNELFDNYIDDITMDGDGGFKTKLAIDTQKKIAADIWKHLITAEARPDYDFLLNHAFVFLLTRLENAQKSRGLSEWEKYMYTNMIKLIKADKNKGYKLMNDLKAYPLNPPQTLYPSNIFAKMISEITHEMLGCLLRLPYFDILKQQEKFNRINGKK